MADDGSRRDAAEKTCGPKGSQVTRRDESRGTWRSLALRIVPDSTGRQLQMEGRLSNVLGMSRRAYSLRSVYRVAFCSMPLLGVCRPKYQPERIVSFKPPTAATRDLRFATDPELACRKRAALRAHEGSSRADPILCRCPRRLP